MKKSIKNKSQKLHKMFGIVPNNHQISAIMTDCDNNSISNLPSSSNIVWCEPCNGHRPSKSSFEISRSNFRMMYCLMGIIYVGVAIHIFTSTRFMSSINSSEVPASSQHPIRSHIGMGGSSTHFIVPAKALIAITSALLVTMGIFCFIIASDIGSFYTESLNNGYPVFAKWILMSIIVGGGLTFVCSVILGVIDLASLILITVMAILFFMCLLWSEMAFGVFVAYGSALIAVAITIAVMFSNHRTRVSEANAGIYWKQSNWRLSTLVSISVTFIAILIINFALQQFNTSALVSDLIIAIISLIGMIITSLIITFGFKSEFKCVL